MLSRLGKVFLLEVGDGILLADVTEKDLEDIRSVENLTFDLGSLFHVKLFQNDKDFSDD
jgi:hypothetical protein